MYKDKKRNLNLYFIGAVILLAFFLLGRYFFMKNNAEELEKETLQAISTAVQKAALQCYAIEGAYPPDLDYLKENYGLNINTEDYYVVYNAYADNQVPDIRVVRKSGNE